MPYGVGFVMTCVDSGRCLEQYVQSEYISSDILVRPKREPRLVDEAFT